MQRQACINSSSATSDERLDDVPTRDKSRRDLCCASDVDSDTTGCSVASHAGCCCCLLLKLSLMAGRDRPAVLCRCTTGLVPWLGAGLPVVRRSAGRPAGPPGHSPRDRNETDRRTGVERPRRSPVRPSVR